MKRFYELQQLLAHTRLGAAIPPHQLYTGKKIMESIFELFYLNIPAGPQECPGFDPRVQITFQKVRYNSSNEYYSIWAHWSTLTHIVQSGISLTVI